MILYLLELLFFQEDLTQPDLDSRYASDSAWIREVRGWPDQANLEELAWKFLGFLLKTWSLFLRVGENVFGLSFCVR